MAASIPVERTYNQDIDGLLSGVRWDSLDLTYSFSLTASVYGAPYGFDETENNFQPLTSFQSAAARKVFTMISDVTSLRFHEIQGTSTQHADLRLARSDKPGTAWTYLPDTAEEAIPGSGRVAAGWISRSPEIMHITCSSMKCCMELA